MNETFRDCKITHSLIEIRDRSNSVNNYLEFRFDFEQTISYSCPLSGFVAIRMNESIDISEIDKGLFFCFISDN